MSCGVAPGAASLMVEEVADMRHRGLAPLLIVAIPVAVKVSPYFSAMASMAARLTKAGASGLPLRVNI